MDLLEPEVSELFPAELVERGRTYKEEAIRTGRTVLVEVLRDGRFFNNLISPIINGGGKVSKLAVFSMDITERQRAEDCLGKASKSTGCW